MHRLKNEQTRIVCFDIINKESGYEPAVQEKNIKQYSSPNLKKIGRSIILTADAYNDGNIITKN